MIFIGKYKYKIEDVILSPREEMTIEFSGYNPFLICTIARNLLRDILKISGSGIREDDVRWDKSDPNKRWFYGVWRGTIEEDKWTFYWVRIAAEGSYNVKDRMGSVKIQLRGHMFTKVDFSNPISLSLWKLFNYVFYWKQRRKYLEWEKDILNLFKQEILKAYGIYQEKR